MALQSNSTYILNNKYTCSLHMSDWESEIAPILLNQLASSEQRSSPWPGVFLSRGTFFSAVQTHIQEAYLIHSCKYTLSVDLEEVMDISTLNGNELY